MGRPLAEFADELKDLSNNISSQVRSIALGLIALVWALLTGLKDSGIGIVGDDRRQLLGVALVSVLTLVLDYAQYLFGYWNSIRILRTAEKAGKSEAIYNARDPRYRARTACFVLKQASALVGAGWMASIIIRLLF